VHACSLRSPPVRVSNVPTAVDDATADVNMFLIIGALRNFNAGILALREGKWRGQPAPVLGHDPEGKVLGVLGMGGIGRNLKRKAEAFGMRVIYHNRRKLAEELSDGAEYVSFDELLARSDVISLNLPLNVGFFAVFFPWGWMDADDAEKHPPYHQQGRIRQDERRRRCREHRPWCGHGRGCSRPGA
jgi:lactate dehydrogenase-like 2-hydroxyacid dehydrogenase